MTSIFLGEEQVSGYLLDLLEQLAAMPKPPMVWCPVTRSGGRLLEELSELTARHFPALLESVTVVPLDLDSEGKVVIDAEAGDQVFSGADVFLFDGSIHSGATLRACARCVLDGGAASLFSYALAVKQSSTFIPSCWGIMIRDQDRAFFQLTRIPNHQMSAGQHAEKQRPSLPPLHVTRLGKEDLPLPEVVSGVASMDRVLWDDRYFDMSAFPDGNTTWLLHSGSQLVGYLTVHFREQSGMHIDEIAIDQAFHHRGLGGVLLRFAETLARHSDSARVTLHAHEASSQFYLKLGYSSVADAGLITLGDEQYHLMHKRLLKQLPG